MNSGPPEIARKLILSYFKLIQWQSIYSVDVANAFCFPMCSGDRKLPKTVSGMKSLLFSSIVFVIAWIMFNSSDFIIEIYFLLLKHHILFQEYKFTLLMTHRLHLSTVDYGIKNKTVGLLFFSPNSIPPT